MRNECESEIADFDKAKYLEDSVFCRIFQEFVLISMVRALKSFKVDEKEFGMGQNAIVVNAI